MHHRHAVPNSNPPTRRQLDEQAHEAILAPLEGAERERLGPKLLCHIVEIKHGKKTTREDAFRQSWASVEPLTDVGFFNPKEVAEGGEYKVVRIPESQASILIHCPHICHLPIFHPLFLYTTGFFFPEFPSSTRTRVRRSTGRARSTAASPKRKRARTRRISSRVSRGF